MIPLAALTLTAALFTAAPASADASPVCPDRMLTLRAEASAADPGVVRVSVTYHGTRACTVARIPTVTFQDLDGSAQPVPAGPTGRYRLAPGDTAYATVRTVADPADAQARRVDALAVSADPSTGAVPSRRPGSGPGTRSRCGSP